MVSQAVGALPLPPKGARLLTSLEVDVPLPTPAFNLHTDAADLPLPVAALQQSSKSPRGAAFGSTLAPFAGGLRSVLYQDSRDT